MNGKADHFRFLNIIPFLFLPYSVFTQNFIPNGGFEDHVGFKELFKPGSYIDHLNNWQVCGDWHVSYSQEKLAQTFSLNTYNHVAPFAKFDTLLIHSGNAMVKLNYTENCSSGDTGCTAYLQTKLVEPLQPGKVYDVSMWVYGKYYPAVEHAALHHIGMYVSRQPMSTRFSNLIKTDYAFTSPVEPNQWTKIHWTIRALCEMNYAVIGIFQNDTFPSQQLWIDNSFYFFIDDVSIQEIKEDTLPPNIKPTPYCEYYEKEEKQRQLESITSIDIYFDSNSSDLDEADQMKLDSFIKANQDRKNKNFVITGHADNEPANNKELSEARADTVKNYLQQKHKLPASSFLTFAFSDSKPKADNLTSSGRSLNRRSTIRTSDLTTSQVFYRKAVEFTNEDSLLLSFNLFKKWLRIVPQSKQVELLLDPRIQKLKNTEYWKLLTQEVKRGYSKQIDSESSFFLDSMYWEDQYYRTYSPMMLSGVIEEVDSVKTRDRAEILKRRDIKDSINLVILQEHLKLKSYPEIKLVGRRPARAFWYILIHCGDSIQMQNALPVLNQLCIKGEAEWDLFAILTDKLHALRNELQEYGTQYRSGPEGKGPFELYPYDDINAVNERRKKIGMAPTADPKENY